MPSSRATGSSRSKMRIVCPARTFFRYALKRFFSSEIVAFFLVKRQFGPRPRPGDTGILLQPFPGALGGPADGCGERPRELIFGERLDGSLLVGARPIRVRASLDLHGDFLVRHRVGAVQADASQRVCLVLLGRSLGTAVGS